MADLSNLSPRDFERTSIGSAWSSIEAEGEDVKAALEKAFAKQLAAKTAVLVATPKGWQVVQLRKLKPSQRELLLAKVYEDTTHPLGFYSKLTERMAKWVLVAGRAGKGAAGGCRRAAGGQTVGRAGAPSATAGVTECGRHASCMWLRAHLSAAPSCPPPLASA